jgi:beta-1,4-mannosyl-glycoprotein beta-1,4-N-acetylglucosaminyltransferase
MRVVDSFLFYNEIKLLEFRLKELNDVVDAFILVESTKTFKGDPKPLHFENNKHLFLEYLPKITHIIIENPPDSPDPWVRERHQRNEIQRGIEKLQLQDDDILYLGDLDEIIKPELLVEARSIGFTGCVCIRLDLYYYNLYTYVDTQWDHAKLMNIGYAKSVNYNLTSVRVKELGEYAVVVNGGWHFSYFGGAEQISKKLKDFAHQEYNFDTYTNVSSIQQCILNQTDIMKRDHVRFLPNDPHTGRTMPKHYKMLL